MTALRSQTMIRTLELYLCSYDIQVDCYYAINARMIQITLASYEQSLHLNLHLALQA